MKIVTQTLAIDELNRMAGRIFIDMVKAVVDVDREVIALEAELHSDLEAMLLEDGAKHKSLWGINLYPQMQGDEFIEFDSMINVRPSQGNMSRGVENQELRAKIRDIVKKRIK